MGNAIGIRAIPTQKQRTIGFDNKAQNKRVTRMKRRYAREPNMYIENKIQREEKMCLISPPHRARRIPRQHPAFRGTEQRHSATPNTQHPAAATE